MTSDLTIIANDSLVLEKKMLGFLKHTRLFFENIITYLKGKRLTKSNFRIEDTSVVPNYITDIEEILDRGEELVVLEHIVNELHPKRCFLFDMMQELMKSEVLSDEERNKAKSICDDYLQKVVWRLCNSELSLVKKKAGSIARGVTSVSFQDKVGYGYEGLLKAAHKFDFEKGIKFNTYASWWIWESILNGCNNEMYFLKVESPKQQKYIKFLSSSRKRDGKESTHLSSSELLEIYAACNIASVYGEDGEDHSDLKIDDSNSEVFYHSNPENILNISQNPRSMLEDTINTKLNKDERKILTHYYGILDCRKRSESQLCRSFGFTITQLRDKIQEILSKIREDMI